MTTNTDPRLAAWDRLHNALARLPGWRLSSPQPRPEGRRWHATAYDGRHRGRGRVHEAMEGTGTAEAEAIEALAEMLEMRATAIYPRPRG